MIVNGPVSPAKCGGVERRTEMLTKNWKQGDLRASDVKGNTFKCQTLTCMFTWMHVPGSAHDLALGLAALPNYW